MVIIVLVCVHRYKFTCFMKTHVFLILKKSCFRSLKTICPITEKNNVVVLKNPIPTYISGSGKNVLLSCTRNRAKREVVEKQCYRWLVDTKSRGPLGWSQGSPQLTACHNVCPPARRGVSDPSGVRRRQRPGELDAGRGCGREAAANRRRRPRRRGAWRPSQGSLRLC